MSPLPFSLWSSGHISFIFVSSWGFLSPHTSSQSLVRGGLKGSSYQPTDLIFNVVWDLLRSLQQLLPRIRVPHRSCMESVSPLGMAQIFEDVSRQYIQSQNSLDGSFGQSSISQLGCNYSMSMTLWKPCFTFQPAEGSQFTEQKGAERQGWCYPCSRQVSCLHQPSAR